MATKKTPPSLPAGSTFSSPENVGLTNFLAGSAPKTSASPSNSLLFSNPSNPALTLSGSTNLNALNNQGIGSLLPVAPGTQTVYNHLVAPTETYGNTLGNGILGLLNDDYQKKVIEALRNDPAKRAPKLLHRKIKAARLAAGYKTQKAFSEVLQCSHGAVSQWEADDAEKRTTPDMHWVLRIALVTGLPPGWLIDDQFANPSEAETVRTLNLADRWHNMPVKLEGALPEGWPENGPKFESATVVDGVGVMLHDSNDIIDPAEKRKHPRPVEIAFRAVEVYLAQRDETLFDNFNRRITDYFHADYFDGSNLVAFIQFRDRQNLWGLRRQIGDLLFAEAMLGKPLRKMILAWGATEQAPETFHKALAICHQAKVHLAYFSHADQGSTQMQAFLKGGNLSRG